ncbi:Prolactin regulatory element-binding protein [Amphibalanus amphitrite]|uniref:Prolactin regulatory element-binding protein n=1 Tax=Amphibalanus amphitrite TaxID=1232801 RepID=A0A6A4WE13_AMPAM|nr:Prolactin regulatory element-binding protein [Amphibalanus amphitrite]KAF0300251.1 Prolactin regulatory element-binding protein [Amphibalanus amphitrite]
MPEDENPTGELLAKVSFPLYTIKALSGQHILVAGGGGSAKTGVANGFQIFELTYSGRQTEAEEVAWHETGDRAIMNCTTFTHGRREMLAAGLDDDLQMYQISRKLVDEDNQGHVLPDEEKFAQTRKRRKSESLSNSQEGRFFRKRRHPSGNMRIGFDITKQESVRTDFNSKGDDSFQKVVRVSLDRTFLVTGGCDGHLRIWKFPGLTKLRDLKAHAKEIDDVDISPSGTRIVSIGKDNKCNVWNTKDGKKAAQLDFDPPQDGCKYMFKKCRFGIVEGDKNNFCLFTLHNPISSSRKPGYIVKWNTTTYVPEKTATVTGSLSALAVSDDGRFLAVGSMESGSVTIFISYSLRPLKTVDSAHHTFVTGLEFLPSGEAARAVTGNSDASVVSISVDNQVKIHHVAQRGTISVLAASLIVIVVMVATFIGCSVLGL